MTKSVTCPEELGGLASQVTVDYAQLAHQGRLAAATAGPEEVRIHELVYFFRGCWEIIVYSYERFNLSCLSGYPYGTVPLKCQTEISAWVCSLHKN